MEKGHFPHLPRKEEHPKRVPLLFLSLVKVSSFRKTFFVFFPPLVGVTPKQNETVTFQKEKRFSLFSFFIRGKLVPSYNKKGVVSPHLLFSFRKEDGLEQRGAREGTRGGRGWDDWVAKKTALHSPKREKNITPSLHFPLPSPVSILVKQNSRWLSGKRTRKGKKYEIESCSILISSHHSIMQCSYKMDEVLLFRRACRNAF